MKDYAIVGRKKAGKTTLAKAVAKRIGAPLLVYDKNAEWGQPLRTMPDFLDLARRARGRVIVIEDAGIFFSPTARHGALLDVLTAARHTRNTCILLFHSLRQVPLYVLEQLDGIYILPTRDLAGKVADRFEDWPDVVGAWNKVQARARKEAHPVEYVRL